MHEHTDGEIQGRPCRPQLRSPGSTPPARAADPAPPRSRECHPDFGARLGRSFDDGGVDLLSALIELLTGIWNPDEEVLEAPRPLEGTRLRPRIVAKQVIHGSNPS
ncbi:hypothetical protein [Nocardia stercoris]|uniref:Uncharacterized protein n=1 Tax=Nocardia stercoris TaxID=2483361 RepID=A0A3M2LC55_9NOCA|nr:hypothetical protein [Nocardia stercoris]RMI35132.1 hypothetical protein EBN03_02135 [Nocardia stercoris]